MYDEFFEILDSVEKGEPLITLVSQPLDNAGSARRGEPQKGG